LFRRSRCLKHIRRIDPIPDKLELQAYRDTLHHRTRRYSKQCRKRASHPYTHRRSQRCTSRIDFVRKLELFRHSRCLQHTRRIDLTPGKLGFQAYRDVLHHKPHRYSTQSHKWGSHQYMHRCCQRYTSHIVSVRKPESNHRSHCLQHTPRIDLSQTNRNFRLAEMLFIITGHAGIQRRVANRGCVATVGIRNTFDTYMEFKVAVRRVTAVAINNSLNACLLIRFAKQAIAVVVRNTLDT